MRVYLAAPYQKKDLIKGYALELQAAGVGVTSSWLDEIHPPTIQMPDLSHEEHQKYALRDLQDIRAAQIFVLFTDPSKTVIRAGRHVEFGVAVERGIPIYVVGLERENIFHHLARVTHIETWEQVRDLLIAVAAA
jgi:hypothetical protein